MYLLGPLGALLFSGVSLGDILALLLILGVTLNNIILNFMLVVVSLALGLIDSLALLGSFTLADKGNMAESNMMETEKHS